MKKLLFVILLFIGTVFTITAQKESDLDSLKNVIFNELSTIVQQNNQELENQIKLVTAEIGQKFTNESKGYSKEAIDDLLVSIKSEANELVNQLIENRVEKILVEVGEMINQANKNLYEDLSQQVVDSEKRIDEETEVLIANLKETIIKEISEIIDNKISENHSSIIERLENENKALEQKIQEQNNLINNLVKRIEVLEKEFK